MSAASWEQLLSLERENQALREEVEHARRIIPALKEAATMTLEQRIQARNFLTALRQVGVGLAKDAEALTAKLTLADAVLTRAEAWLARVEEPLPPSTGGSRLHESEPPDTEAR